MSMVKVAMAAFLLAAPALAQSETTPTTETAAPTETYAEWITRYRARALAAGISAATFDNALGNVAYLDSVVELDANQAEFSKALWEYLDTAVSDARIQNGQAAMARYGQTLTAIESEYGVEKEIVAAIWGLESAYGAVRGNTSTIAAMTTLAYAGRREEFFEEQLTTALQILDSGETTPANMIGSWAGAMGHTQFMPTSYRDYAVDGNDDGRRNIWGDDPTDALASTANYLSEFGWTTGQPWGVEVTLPDGFDYTMARRDNEKRPSEWAALGVLDMSGQPVPDHGPATILLPAGHKGAAFMIFPNFEVLEAYNTADAYVIGVGHLADRIAGGGPIQTPWPRTDRALTGPERRELQQLLTNAGFDPQGIDGRIGPLTINAIRNYQLANGLVPDGYASPMLLEHIR